MAVVVLVCGDAALRQSVARTLGANDFRVIETAGGLEALRVIFDQRPEAAIIDLRVTDIAGIELIRVVRAASDLAIIALAGGGDAARSVQALEAGADDVAKTSTPPAELMARLRAAMRRSLRVSPSSMDAHVVHTGALVIDRDTRTVTRHGKYVPLTRTEYRLLDALASTVGQVAPHRFLLSSVWGDAYADDTHYLRVYIGYLRAKLEDDPSSPVYLQSEWGVGYRLALLPAEEPAEADGAESTGGAGTEELSSPPGDENT